MTFPRLANNHLHLETWASHRDYPQENFFGLGPDSDRDDRSDYAIRTNHFGGRVGVRPPPGTSSPAAASSTSSRDWARDRTIGFRT